MTPDFRQRKVPLGIYLPQFLPEDINRFVTTADKFEHVCIDDNPYIELILRYTLAKIGLYPDSTDKIYAWVSLKGKKREYFFASEVQHREIQNLLNSREQPCEE